MIINLICATIWISFYPYPCSMYYSVNKVCIVCQTLCKYQVNAIVCSPRRLKHAIIGNPRNKQHYAKLGVVDHLSHILNDQELTDNILLAECIVALGSFAHGNLICLCVLCTHTTMCVCVCVCVHTRVCVLVCVYVWFHL